MNTKCTPEKKGPKLPEKRTVVLTSWLVITDFHGVYKFVVSFKDGNKVLEILLGCLFPDDVNVWLGDHDWCEPPPRVLPTSTAPLGSEKWSSKQLTNAHQFSHSPGFQFLNLSSLRVLNVRHDGLSMLAMIIYGSHSSIKPHSLWGNPPEKCQWNCSNQPLKRWYILLMVQKPG